MVSPSTCTLARPLACSALVLAACGGGGGGNDPAASCGAGDEKSWLRCYMYESYFWYALSPSPDPAGYATLSSYFDALLFQGNADFPRDTYSYYESTASFNQFWGDGETLGYGLFVAGRLGRVLTIAA